ncbi:PREDICTED: HVA22-like protein c [Fragaria vesca subsp. vesca]|uniref:HVA22-like protein c n=1 Tax=Fragaria vesca subsp. vesca TaxID=101020 RepID=UPI0002C2DFE1|nr:PREDICTED: HVA22-like protein c [Fragaria vesca subsp. vesca]
MGRSTGSGNNFLQVVANNFDVLALPLVTLVFPLYASIRAIETKSRTDDQQWLTYWVLYSLITLFEITFAKILECFPIWAYGKLILTCWLVLPQFNGAAYVYRRFIRPFYMNPQMMTNINSQQIWYFPRSKDKKNIFSKPDDVLTAAEKYMEEHGTEAFERLITKTDREARARSRSNNYLIFDDDYMY